MNRTVLITGASSGLGLSLAKRFLSSGDTVYGISKTKRHWSSAQEFLSRPRNFFLFRGDISKEATARRLAAKISRQAKRIDVLINNAGYANPPVRIEEEKASEFRKNFQNNLMTTFFMCKYTLPFFLKQGEGWVVNIASMAGKRAVPRLSAYSASKFGVVALTQCLAKENPLPGLHFITVCPGGIDTEMRVKLFGKEDAQRQQSSEFVAEKIFEVVERKINVPSGGDIVIRHRKITAVNPLPEA